MNVNLLQGLGSSPDAVGGTNGDANAALRRHRAWQSAMEQAQLANWFKPGDETAGDASAAPPTRTTTAALIGRFSSDPSASPAPEDGAPQDGPASAAQEPSARAVAPEPTNAPAAAREHAAGRGA